MDEVIYVPLGISIPIGSNSVDWFAVVAFFQSTDLRLIPVESFISPNTTTSIGLFVGAFPLGDLVLSEGIVFLAYENPHPNHDILMVFLNKLSEF